MKCQRFLYEINLKVINKHDKKIAINKCETKLLVYGLFWLKIRKFAYQNENMKFAYQNSA